MGGEQRAQLDLAVVVVTRWNEGHGASDQASSRPGPTVRAPWARVEPPWFLTACIEAGTQNELVAWQSRTDPRREAVVRNWQW